MTCGLGFDSYYPPTCDHGWGLAIFLLIVIPVILSVIIKIIERYHYPSTK